MFLALLWFVGSAACPDLSGSYVIQGEDGRVDVLIRQQACTRVFITWNIYSHPDTARSTHTLLIDGAFHRDTAWFGATGRQLTAVRFHGDTLEIVARAIGAPDSSFLWKHYISKRGPSDISTRMVNPPLPARRPNEQLLLPAHAAVAAGSLRSPAAFFMIAPQQNCGR